MDILDKIFGSAIKVRLMRLFLLNPEQVFSVKDVVTRTLLREKGIKQELIRLEKIDLIKRKKTQKVTTWTLNSKFIYLQELQYFLINAQLLKHSDIVKKLHKIGKIKGIIIAGVFLHQQEDSRLDLVIIGDDIAKAKLETSVKHLEAEIGKELKYTLFETSDFLYRIGMYDKLVREIFDYPHQILLDRIGFKR